LASFPSKVRQARRMPLIIGARRAIDALR